MTGYANIFTHKRAIEKVSPKSRQRCWCGCNRRGTHYGTANGIGMTSPMCEMQARRWMKSPESAFRTARRQTGGVS